MVSESGICHGLLFQHEKKTTFPPCYTDLPLPLSLEHAKKRFSATDIAEDGENARKSFPQMQILRNIKHFSNGGGSESIFIASIVPLAVPGVEKGENSR